MEYNSKREVSGVAKGGLTTGIIGTSLGALALLGGGAGALLGNGGSSLFGGRNSNGTVAQAYMDGLMMQALMGQGQHTAAQCESDHLVTRYDADKDHKIMELEAKLAHQEADAYTDKKILELYQHVEGRLRGVEGQIAQQAVINQANTDRFQLVTQEMECCCSKQTAALEAEKAARCCGDNAIVNYANATFYPQLIADLTVGTTAKAQNTWNPIGNCGCNG